MIQQTCLIVRDSSSVWLSSRWERRLLFRTLFLCVMGMDSASTLLGFSLQRNKGKTKILLFSFLLQWRNLYIPKTNAIRKCNTTVTILSTPVKPEFRAFLARTDATRFLTRERFLISDANIPCNQANVDRAWLHDRSRSQNYHGFQAWVLTLN